MNEEENQAIEKFENLLKKHFEDKKIDTLDYLDYFEGITILNLIEKQQKKIEKLEKEKRILIEKYTDVVYKCGKRNEEIKYLKKRLYRKGVFSKEKFVRFYPKQYQNDYVKKWVDESDGLTPREMEELGYDVLKDCLI